MKKGVLTLGLLSISVCAFLGFANDGQAQDKIRWKMQSAFGSQLPHLGPPGQRFSKDIELMSGGKLEIRFYEPGALVPASMPLAPLSTSMRSLLSSGIEVSPLIGKPSRRKL